MVLAVGLLLCRVHQSHDYPVLALVFWPVSPAGFTGEPGHNALTLFSTAATDLALGLPLHGPAQCTRPQNIFPCSAIKQRKGPFSASVFLKDDAGTVKVERKPARLLTQHIVIDTTPIVNMKLLPGCHFFANRFLTGRTWCIMKVNAPNPISTSYGFVSGANFASVASKFF
ncbi:MAG: hypothetical protein AAFW83_03705 [Pseudomonadota bacterium]